MNLFKSVKHFLECLNMQTSVNHSTRDDTYEGTCIEKYPENIHTCMCTLQYCYSLGLADQYMYMYICTIISLFCSPTINIKIHVFDLEYILGRINFWMGITVQFFFQLKFYMLHNLRWKSTWTNVVFNKNNVVYVILTEKLWNLYPNWNYIYQISSVQK